MYVDDGAIYAVSTTTNATALSTVQGLEDVLQWLHRNGLTADPDKTELITFAKQPRNPDLIGGDTIGIQYRDPVQGLQHVTAVPRVRYLGLFLDCKLTWRHHVDIMASHARSTIRGINVLGNSVRGLDLLNWRKVYNALVIPILTYGATVWYTGIGQKGLTDTLQVAQNEGLWKITGAFCTTLTEPLHNMTGILPISYLLPKLLDAYTLRLQSMPPDALICTVLTDDRCHYWPEWFLPLTNLCRALAGVGPSTYHPIDPCTAGLWTHPQLTYFPSPTPGMLDMY